MTDARDAGAKHRDAMARRSRERQDSVADIGELPAVENPERRERCKKSLFDFLTSYFPQTTGLKPFSDDHRRVIERIETCIREGGRFVNAVYRGFAKTTISENAAIWAVIYGFRRFVPIFGAGQNSADGNIDSIKRELEDNDLLLADFPEVCFAIRALEGKPQRQHSQTYRGELTHIRWRADTIVLPTIPGSVASGAILCAHGLTGATRGLKYKRADGIQARPDFAIIDDPQTDESASSPLQVRKRLEIIRKSILKAGGHNKALAVVINATVIQPDDLIDQLLDAKRNPAWQGERIKMVRRWSAAHETLWLKDYAELRSTYDSEDPQSQRQAKENATRFYVENRAAMDADADVSWHHCFDPDCEASAIQHAYNALIDDGPEVFASEFQNSPELPATQTRSLSAEQIAAKINGYARGRLPQDAAKLTGFIDVQKDALFWLVAAWAEGFTGFVVDYGVFPEQKRDRFTLRDLRRKLSDIYPGAGLEATIFAGLGELTKRLFSTSWLRDDGSKPPLERLLVDANWGESSETVYSFCRQTKLAVMPSHGIFVKASSAGLNDRKRKPGEARGLNWRIPPLAGGKPVRHVLFDANYWKSFVARRLATPAGDSGALTLFDAPPRAHAMLAEHLTAETATTVEANGRKSEQWDLRPGKPDNHFLDCLVGSAVAASMLRISLDGHREAVATSRPRRRMRVNW